MNVKNHHFSIRLRVSSQTTSKRKCGVAFLHSTAFYSRRLLYDLSEYECERELEYKSNFFSLYIIFHY